MASRKVKLYQVTQTKHRNNKEYKSGFLPLPELVEYYSYTLECGESYQHEKGNKKINRNPKSIKALITALNNAVNNSAANGYAGVFYSYEEGGHEYVITN